jgi:hypothetical protein
MAARPLPLTTMGSGLLNRSTIPLGLTRKPLLRRVRTPQRMARNVSKDVKFIFYRKEAFCLRRPITLNVRREGGFWVHSYRPLGILAYGRTKLDSLLAFAVELSSAWHWIAQEADDKLAPDARRLKQRLADLIASVRPIGEVLSEIGQNC